MNNTTYRAVVAVLDADLGVSDDRKHAALAILDGHAPGKWPEEIQKEMKKSQFSTVPTEGNHTNDVKNYYDRIEAANYIGMSVRMLDLLKSRGDIPFIRISRRKVMFTRSDLDNFMNEQRIDIGSRHKKHP